MDRFNKARSINSVMYAMECDSLRSFYDTLSEAHIATNNMKKVEETCIHAEP